MIAEYLSTILKWYRIHGRHSLPWRNIDSLTEEIRGYYVWLSEILLQQTQVYRAIPFYEHILERFPTIHDLAKTSYEDFFPYYKGLGYYSRARNMLKTALIISSEYAGYFPHDAKKLSILPGIGKYTSDAIRAFAYNIPTLAWDTNLEKVFSRFLHGSRFLKLNQEEKGRIESCIFSSAGINARDINAALMDWANLVDYSNKGRIKWESYPSIGLFSETIGVLEISPKKNTRFFPFPDATIIVILHREHRVYFSDELLHPSFTFSGSVLPKGIPSYIPFILPPSGLRDTRKVVQEYFRTRYGLEISVRPPHEKGFNDSGLPYVLVNAQIQAGVYNFTELIRG